MRYNTIQYYKILYNTIQNYNYQKKKELESKLICYLDIYELMQYNTMQYYTILYQTIQNKTIHNINILL